MVNIESNEASQAEIQEALASLGFAEPAEEAVEAAPGEETKPEPTGTPGEKPPEPEGKTAAGTEPAKTEPQEVPGGEPVEHKKGTKGGLKAKTEQLAARVDSLKEALEEERGDKAKLRAKLEEAEARLAEAHAEAPAQPKGEAELVKPKRPTRAAVEFDEDKYEEAMTAYETELDKYNTAVTEKRIADALKADREATTEARRQEEAARVENAFVQRKDEGSKAYEDFSEMLEAADGIPTVFDTDLSPEETAMVAVGYLKYDSEHPADLIYYFAHDAAENGGVESKRLASMKPVRLVQELGKIEERIQAERNGTKPAPKEEKTVAPAAEVTKPKPVVPAAEVPPAKPRPAPGTPDEPIQTVGGREVVNPGNLNKQLEAAAARNDFREVRRIRDLQRMDEGRRAGRIA